MYEFPILLYNTKTTVRSKHTPTHQNQHTFVRKMERAHTRAWRVSFYIKLDYVNLLLTSVRNLHVYYVSSERGCAKYTQVCILLVCFRLGIFVQRILNDSVL